MASLLSTIIKGFISSERFISGFMGEGWKIWNHHSHRKEDGSLSQRYKLEIDDLTVRNSMTVYELLIEKIRALKGSLGITQACGKVETVTQDEDYFYLTIEEDEMSFMENDIIRCQRFDTVDKTLKGYWVEVTGITDGINPDGSKGKPQIKISKSEFIITASGEGQGDNKEMEISYPASGDDIVQFGNSKNKDRQSAIYLTTESGVPKIQILDGITGKSFNGCNRVILGSLNGMTDEEFKENQPQGYGMWADNVYLKGTLVGSEGYLLNKDGSGYIGGGAIKWEKDNQDNYKVSMEGNVVLSWDNLSEETKNNLKGEKGDSGKSPYLLNLTNDNVTLPATYEGVIQNYTLAKTTAQLFLGQTQVKEVVFQYEAANPGITINQSGDTFSVTSMSANLDNTQVIIYALLNGEKVASSVFTISKSKAGISGEDATVYYLVINPDIIKKKKDGALNVTSITAMAYKQVGNHAPENKVCNFRYRSSINSAWIYSTMSTLVVEVNPNMEWVDIELIDNSSNNNILDSERVLIVADGEDGINGSNGTNGTNGKDADIVFPWLNEWQSNGTNIGGEHIASPKMFAGKRNPDNTLNGVVFGKDISVNGEKRTGLFGVKNDELTFSVDAENGSIKIKSGEFTGKVNAKSGVFNDVLINGSYRNSFRDGYYSIGESGGITVGTLGLQKNNHVIITGSSAGWIQSFNVPFTADYNGFPAIILNEDYNNSKSIGMIEATAPSGKFFYENGKQSNKLSIYPKQGVEMIGLGEGNNFKGWLIKNRFSTTSTTYSTGFPFVVMYSGLVENGTLKRYMGYDTCKLTSERIGQGYYRVYFSVPFSSISNYTVMLTGIKYSSDKANQVYASLVYQGLDYFEVKTADDDSTNDGSFNFLVINTNRWGL